MNIHNLIDVSSELIVLLAAHFVESAHHIHMFDIACGSLNCGPKLRY